MAGCTMQVKTAEGNENEFTDCKQEDPTRPVVPAAAID